MCKKESRQKETRALLTILCKTNTTCTLLLKFRLRLKFYSVEKFCILLQTRLKNSYAIFIKVISHQSSHICN